MSVRSQVLKALCVRIKAMNEEHSVPFFDHPWSIKENKCGNGSKTLVKETVHSVETLQVPQTPRVQLELPPASSVLPKFQKKSQRQENTLKPPLKEPLREPRILRSSLPPKSSLKELK